MLCFRFAPWSRHRCAWLLSGLLLALTWSTSFDEALPDAFLAAFAESRALEPRFPATALRGARGRTLDAGSSASRQLFAGLVLLGTGCCGRLAWKRTASLRRGKAKDAVVEALGEDFFNQLRARVTSSSASGSRSLRPLIVAMGTRGDAEPGFRLAAALKERGHEPLVVSLDAYKEEAVNRWNLDFRSCGLERVPLSEEYLTGQTRADQVYSDRGWYGDAWTMVGERLHAAALEHRCDFIVTTSMGNTHCLDVAEQLDLLCIALKFCPDIDGQVPTGDFPPSGYPSLPGPLNYLQHLLENSRTVAAVFRGGYIPKVIDFRTQLGMESMEIPGVGAKVPTYSELRQKQQANQPSLYAFSDALADRPQEYQPWHFVTGSFSAHESRDVELPGALESFLSSSPICIAFGSISLARGDDDGVRGAPFQRRALAAARRCQVPVLVVDPEVEVEGPDADDPGVYRLRSAPYSALFPRCRLVVHHGGAGTAQDAVRAECPQLVAPVLAWSDQPFWAREVEERKLGVKVGEGGRAPSDEDWDRALQRCLASLEEFQRNARGAKERMMQEGGVQMACQIIEDVMLS